MTGLIGMAQTLAISALAATGLLMAGGQFHTDGQASVSSETGATAGAETESGGQTSTGIDADASAQVGATISADTDCLDNNCPAPCATACADPLRPALDGAGAVEDAAAFGAAVAPEPPCVCADERSSVALEAEGDAGLESDSSTTDLGASLGASATFGVAGN